MKRDYSEYELSEYEKYRCLRSDSKYAKLSFYQNTARFDSESKKIFIRVDPVNEYVYRMEDIEEDERRHNNGCLRPRYTSEEDKTEFDKMRKEDLAENERDFQALCSRYDIDRTNFDMHVEYFYSEHPEEEEEPLNNVLGGSYIHIPYGEGILDFIYADFKPAYEEALRLPLLLKQFGEFLKREEPESFSEDDESQTESRPEKVYNRTQDIVEEYNRYASTVRYVKDISYTSLYTAICPPVFSSDYDTLPALRWYYHYLITLQNEYLELLEFCFDEEFYPEVLGHLHPAERYYLYRNLNNQPEHLRREELFSLEMNIMSGREMPYGLAKEDLIARLNKPIVMSEHHVEFAKRYGADIKDLEFCLRYPHFLNIQYEFCSVADILELEFSKILEQNIRFRKCKRCGKYFIMKGNYDTRYCERIAPGEKRKCQDLAAQENYKKKNAGNESLQIYSKYYKRYAARVRVGQIKEADFKMWKYAALTKRDECADGSITVDEFIEWMEASFPNRKKKGNEDKG